MKNNRFCCRFDSTDIIFQNKVCQISEEEIPITYIYDVNHQDITSIFSLIFISFVFFLFQDIIPLLLHTNKEKKNNVRMMN